MKRLRSIAILTAFLLVGGVVAQDDHVADLDRKTQEISPEGTSSPGSIFVNNNGDATDATPGDGVCETATGNGTCTLRAAVVEANAAAGVDIITFDPAITLIQVNGQIPITSAMTIIGNPPSSPTIQNTAPVGTTSRVFNISNVVVNLHQLAITGGNVTGSGGGILNAGTLTITSCVIEGNNANGAGGTGGGIRSTNSLTIMNSTISGNASIASTSGGISFAGSNLTIGYSTIAANSSFGNGGGLNVSATVSARITNSIINSNTAGASSGGMFLNRGIVTSSTISGNTANGALATEGGGGVRIQAGVNSVTFTSCTITANSAPNTTMGSRSGVWHETGTVNFMNTIVAANVSQDIQRDGTAVVMSGGFNVIGENTSVETEFTPGSPSGTNYVGTNAAPLDPMLGPVAANGGPTRTHALMAGSVAIDKGNSFGLPVDQRRFVRLVDLPGTDNAPGGDGTDIGAYEFESTGGVTVVVSGQVVESAGSTPLSRARVALTDSTGIRRNALTNPFGYFRFDGVDFGESYIVSVNRKGYRQAVRIITPEADADLLIGLDP